jgi:hypothetical protein
VRPANWVERLRALLKKISARQVVALIRDPAKLPELAESGVEAALSEISGKAVSYEGISVSEFITDRVAAGFPEATAAFLTEWAQAVVQGEYAEVTGDLERLIGRKPTGYREVLKSTYGASVVR